MRITIEDLEALKELSDELEENHMETGTAEWRPWCVEFQNSSGIWYLNFFSPTEAKEAQVREHLRKVESLEEVCVDYEGTIQQFREPVLQLRTFVPVFYRDFLFRRCWLFHFWFPVSSTNCTRKPKPPNLNRLLQLLGQRTSCPSTWNQFRKIRHEQSTLRSRVSKRRSARSFWASFKYVTLSSGCRLLKINFAFF